MGTFDFSQDSKNYFKIMLNLEYDLNVAENQCNWNAKEIIAKALLTAIEKYGISIQNQSMNTPEVQTMVDAQNMAALHAAIALKQIIAQRKTTEICKNNLHLNPNDIHKTYAHDSMEQDLALDHLLEQYLTTANNDAFLIGSSIFPVSSNGSFNDIMELAKIIDNPKIMDIFLSSFGYYRALNGTAQQNRDSYGKIIVNFVDQNFNFNGKEFLRKISIDYFMKTYDKMEYRLNRLTFRNLLKLRDCNGKDIYGNINVCTYCATCELIRRNPENDNFIAFGGMFDLPTINKITNEALAGKGYRPSLLIPYRRFNRDGQKVYDSEEEQKKLNQKIDDFIKDHSQHPIGVSSFYECKKKNDSPSVST
jgi:hypothetical protein